VKELKKALARYQKDGDAATVLAACDVVAARYAHTPPPEAQSPASPWPRLQGREQLRLICYEFLS
jgi:hypothetical protein